MGQPVNPILYKDRALHYVLMYASMLDVNGGRFGLGGEGVKRGMGVGLLTE